MNEFKLDDETVARIAHAVSVLPGIDSGRFLEVLIDSVGEDLNTASLKNITVTHLKTGMGSVDGEEDGEDIGIGLAAMKEAVRILWGEDGEDNQLPVPVPYADGDMPGSIRVAIASNSAENLDGHFGSCLRYLVYQVSPDESRLIGVRSAIDADLADDKNRFRIDLIRDCQIVYIVSAGGPAAAKIVQAGIYPIKEEAGGKASAILANLRKMISDSPPPWIAKIMGVSSQDRFKNYQG